MRKTWIGLIAAAGLAALYFVRTSAEPEPQASGPISEHAAFLLCRAAITKEVQGAGETFVPYAANWGGGGSSYWFAWNASTVTIRTRRDGQPDATTYADCYVNGERGEITELKIDGRQVRAR